jgi:replicative DNA helicase
VNAQLDRMPPADVDAEMVVLSAALLSADGLQDALSVLRPEHFWMGQHQLIWRAIEGLVEANIPVDVVAVSGRLRDSGKLDQVGGNPYLAEILNAPAVSNLDAHVKRVLDKARLRALIDVCRGTIAEAYGDVEDVDTFVADHAAKVDLIIEAKVENTQVSLRDAVRAEVTGYDQRKRGATPGIPTGFKQLDHQIGGLKRGVPYVVAARPGIGKTGFLCSVALNVAESGLGGVVVFSIEMPTDQLTQRMVAQVGVLNTRAIEQAKLRNEEHAAYAAACQKLQSLPIVIDDASMQSSRTMRSAVRRARREMRKNHSDINLALIVVDYIQIMTSESKRRNGSRDEDVSEMSRACRNLAKEFRCPVLILSQLSRECEKRPDKRPLLPDLRESGSLEQDAFGVFMLYREDAYRKDGEEHNGEAEVIVRKLRQGGSTGTIRMRFHAPSAGFSDLVVHDYSQDFD